MTIRLKTIILIVVAIVMFELLLLGVQRLVILPSFIGLERNEAQDDLERAILALDNEIGHLDALCHDWASWDDTVNFIKGQSPTYAAATLNDTTLVNARLNLVWYLDASGKQVWNRSLNLQSREELPFPEAELADLPSRAGILLIGDKVMMVASRPILGSDERGPPQGTLVFGRFLDDEGVGDLNKQTQVQFAVLRIGDPDHAAETDKVLEQYHRGVANPIEKVSDQLLRIHGIVRDINGREALVVRTVFPREIAQEGLAAMRLALIFALGTGLIILLLVVIGLDTTLLRPLHRLTQHTRSIQESGDYSARVGIKRRDEVGILAGAFDAMIEKIQSQTTELETLSFRDGLTGVFNRRYFDQHLDLLVGQHRREKNPLSLVICDIDFFKKFNDTYGHLAGDDCLKRVAQAIARQCKRPIDLVTRYGGEEFAVILFNTDQQGAVDVAETIRRAVFAEKIPHAASAADGLLSLSLGVTTVIPNAAVNASGLIGAADKALYSAKECGRNRVVFQPFPA